MHSKSVPRRQHGAELKAKVLEACEEPGASISAVALAHGLNANLVRKWREGRGLKRVGLALPGVSALAVPGVVDAPPSAAAPAPLIPSDARFVPIGKEPLQARRAERPDAAEAAQAVIQVDLRRGPLQLSVRWPTSAAGDCVAWLSELTSGLPK